MGKRIQVSALLLCACFVSFGFAQDISRLDPPSIIRGDANLIGNGFFNLSIYGGYFFPQCVPVSPGSTQCILTDVTYPPPIVRFAGTQVTVTSRQLFPRADTTAPLDPKSGNLYEAEVITVAVPPSLIARTGSAPNPGYLVQVQTGVALGSPVFAPSYLMVDWRIDAVVGTGDQGYLGDGGLASAAHINFPVSIAFNNNYLYIADTCNSCIRRVNLTTKIIERFAGQCTPNMTVSCGDPLPGGYGGDGGPALLAQLKNPYGIAFDSPNPGANLYIADTSNQIIRKVDMSNPSNPIITTVAGVPLVCGNNGDGGAATSAHLQTPVAIVFDNLTPQSYYIVDNGNQRIRKVTNGTINAFAGLCLNPPPEGCCDPKIQSCQPPCAPAYAGDNGPAAQARLSVPAHLAFSTDATSLYVADYGNKRVRRIEMTSPQFIISTVAGVGTSITEPGGYFGDFGSASEAWLNWPISLASPPSGLPFANNIFVSDRHNMRIRQIDAGLKASKSIAGSGIGGFGGDYNPVNPSAFPGLATNAQLFQQTGIAFDPANGELYIIDNHNHKIRKISR
ncbi:MAG: hypothetical protein HYR55_16105 [Acidobacteria bacterium]|nr:hypothetical protein [Acidobacteriota bacterium]MBI3657582.1 hypothetical protein [Acidobacteriota bacterium]